MKKKKPAVSSVSNAVATKPAPLAPPAGADPTPASKLRHLLIVMAVLAGLTFLMFGDVLLGKDGVILSNRGTDLSSQYTYWREFGFNQLKQGVMPLWDPHVFSGVPFVGGFRSAMLYPPNLIFLTMPVDRAINASIALHVFLLGLFVYLWAWRRKMSPAAGLLAAAMAMFGGPYFLHIYAGHLCVVSTAVWAPLLFLAADGLLAEAKLKWVLTGALAVAMSMLAGNLQCAYYTFLALFIYALACGIGSLRSLRAAGVAKLAGLLLAVFAAGAALAAAQVLTGVEAAGESPRIAGVTPEYAGSFSFPPENLLTFLAPGLFGDMTNHTYWGRCFLWEMSVFTGITGFVLAILGACKGDKATRRFFALTAIILLVLALGSHLPTFKLLYAAVPGYNKFRGNSKFVIPAAVFLAMLSGMGLDVLLKGFKSGLVTLLSLAAGAAVLGAGAMWVGSSYELQGGLWAKVMQAIEATKEVFVPGAAYTDPTFVSRAGQFAVKALLIAAGTTVLLTLLLWSTRFFSKAVYAVAVLAVIEVFAFALNSRETFNLADIRAADIQKYLAQQPGDYRIMNLYWPNAAISMGAYDVGGYEPGAVRRRYAEFVAWTQGQELDKVDDFPPITRPHPLFALMRCRFAFVPTAEGLKLSQMEKPPLPHLLLVREARVVTGGRDAVLAAMGDAKFDPAATVVLESTPTPAPDPAGKPGEVKLVESTVNSLTIDADLPAPAVLLITDAYAKGWRAVPLPDTAQVSYDLLPADYAFRAVPLAAGKHHFRVEYAPRGYTIGKWVSLASLLAFLAACVWLWVSKYLTRMNVDKRG